MRVAVRQRPIDFAPAKVRAHGLSDAHARPLVGRRRGTGRSLSTWRTSPQQAWRLPFLELRTANSYPAIILDCDDPERLVDALSSQRVPEPSWTVTSLDSGHHQAVWSLAKPIHRYPEARPRPLIFLQRMIDYYTWVAGADPGYVGVLTRNPMAAADPDTSTSWGCRDPYSLQQLAKFVPSDWKEPRPAFSGVGRNVDMFFSLMRWAGREANRDLPVLLIAEKINEHYASEGQGRLPTNEIRATARSVERYRRRWEAAGWHRPAWIESRRRRGRRGGIESGIARRQRTQERDSAIVTAIEKGQSTRAIAKLHGLTHKGVAYIVARDSGK